MSSHKSNRAKKKRSIAPITEADSTKNLTDTLQFEVDRLALLLEEVKQQTGRVQAAADAIGANVLFESQFAALVDTSSPALNAGSMLNSRQGKILHFTGAPEERAPGRP